MTIIVELLALWLRSFWALFSICSSQLESRPPVGWLKFVHFSSPVSWQEFVQPLNNAVGQGKHIRLQE